MTMQQLADAMNTVRGFTLHTVQGIEPGSLATVPAGFKNNILWNLGHIACVQAALLYGPCGKPSPLPGHYPRMFYDGTSPAMWDTVPEDDEVLGTLRSLNETIVHDHNAGVFTDFHPFDLVPGYRLADAEAALSFHTVHEGIHLGVIMALKKLV